MVSDRSRQEYARLVAELVATPPPAVAAVPPPSGGYGVTVNEVLLAFWRHAERHYRRADRTPTNELPQYRQTFRLVKELYGRTPAAEFGPRSLKTLRQKMIDAGWNRKLVNQLIGRVRRVFEWAASEELIPPAVYQALSRLSRTTSVTVASVACLAVSPGSADRLGPYCAPPQGESG